MIKNNKNNRKKNHLPLQHDYSPAENDVICGRGKAFARLPGNILFVDILRSNLDRYVAAEKRLDKTLVVASVVEQIRATGARFIIIKHDDHADNHDHLVGSKEEEEEDEEEETKNKKKKKKSQFYELSALEIHEKTGHALRDLLKNRGGNSSRQEHHHQSKKKHQRSTSSTHKISQRRRRSSSSGAGALPAPDFQPSPLLDSSTSTFMSTKKDDHHGVVVLSMIGDHETTSSSLLLEQDNNLLLLAPLEDDHCGASSACCYASPALIEDVEPLSFFDSSSAAPDSIILPYQTFSFPAAQQPGRGVVLEPPATTIRSTTTFAPPVLPPSLQQQQGTTTLSGAFPRFLLPRQVSHNIDDLLSEEAKIFGGDSAGFDLFSG